jgi:hypothetical protein
MAASFPFRCDYRNRRQTQRSHRTTPRAAFSPLPLLLLLLLLCFSPPQISCLPQVSSLNRVFEGVEGIDILQARAPALCIRSHALVYFDVMTLLMHTDVITLLMHTHSRASHQLPLSASRSRLCATRSSVPSSRQRSRSGLQARLPILCGRRGHCVPSAGKSVFGRPMFLFGSSHMLP